jgi:hypothetical protein
MSEDDHDKRKANNERLRSTTPLIEQLRSQLIRNHMQRTQTRDYNGILSDSTRPVHWYKKIPLRSRSNYFYDDKRQVDLPTKSVQATSTVRVHGQVRCR